MNHAGAGDEKVERNYITGTFFTDRFGRNCTCSPVSVRVVFEQSPRLRQQGKGAL